MCEKSSIQNLNIDSDKAATVSEHKQLHSSGPEQGSHHIGEKLSEFLSKEITLPKTVGLILDAAVMPYKIVGEILQRNASKVPLLQSLIDYTGRVLASLPHEQIRVCSHGHDHHDHSNHDCAHEHDQPGCNHNHTIQHDCNHQLVDNLVNEEPLDTFIEQYLLDFSDTISINADEIKLRVEARSIRETKDNNKPNQTLVLKKVLTSHLGSKLAAASRRYNQIKHQSNGNIVIMDSALPEELVKVRNIKTSLNNLKVFEPEPVPSLNEATPIDCIIDVASIPVLPISVEPNPNKTKKLDESSMILKTARLLWAELSHHLSESNPILGLFAAAPELRAAATELNQVSRTLIAEVKKLNNLALAKEFVQWAKSGFRNKTYESELKEKLKHIGFDTAYFTHMADHGLTPITAIAISLMTQNAGTGAVLLALRNFATGVASNVSERIDKINNFIKDSLPEEVELVDGSKVRIADLRAGVDILVRADKIVPVDCEVKGSLNINDFLNTGEKTVRQLKTGDIVYQGTEILENATLKTIEIAQDSFYYSLGKLVVNALKGADKMPEQLAKAEKFKQRLLRYTIPLVSLVVPITTIFKDLNSGMLQGAQTAIAMTPCALDVGVSTAYRALLSAEAAKGNFIQNPAAISLISQMSKDPSQTVIALDFTGPILDPKCFKLMHDADMSYVGAYGDFRNRKGDLIQMVAALENASEHPLAIAMQKFNDSKRFTLIESEELVSIGIKGKVVDVHTGILHQIELLNSEEFEKSGNMVAKIRNADKVLHKHLQSVPKKSSFYALVDGEPVGYFPFEGEIRHDAANFISQIKFKGYNVAIISGNQPGPVYDGAEKLGIDREFVFANHKQQNTSDDRSFTKSERIEEDLKNRFKHVVYVPDKINDSLAVGKADLSICLRDMADLHIVNASDITVQNLEAVTDLFDRVARTEKIAQLNRKAAKGSILSNIVFSASGLITPEQTVLLHEVPSAVLAFNSIFAADKPGRIVKSAGERIAAKLKTSFVNLVSSYNKTLDRLKVNV